jgi:hypothetical protein
VPAVDCWFLCSILLCIHCCLATYLCLSCGTVAGKRMCQLQASVCRTCPLLFKPQLSRSSLHAQLLISGLGTLVCRHGHLLSLLNVFEGERHAYAIVALEELRKKGVIPNVFWYDINCK